MNYEGHDVISSLNVQHVILRSVGSEAAVVTKNLHGAIGSKGSKEILRSLGHSG
jgi:hypothetical protein